jgi:hypothetical protein
MKELNFTIDNYLVYDNHMLTKIYRFIRNEYNRLVISNNDKEYLLRSEVGVNNSSIYTILDFGRYIKYAHSYSNLHVIDNIYKYELSDELKRFIKDKCESLYKYITVNNIDYIEYGFSVSANETYSDDPKWIYDKEYSIRYNYNFLDIISICQLVSSMVIGKCSNIFVIDKDIADKKILSELSIYDIEKIVKRTSSYRNSTYIGANLIFNTEIHTKLFSNMFEHKFCDAVMKILTSVMTVRTIREILDSDS